MGQILRILNAIGFCEIFLVIGNDVVRVGVVDEPVYDAVLAFQDWLLRGVR